MLNFSTTLNGKTTVHSAETAQHAFSVGFLVVFIIAIFSLIFGIIDMKKKKVILWQTVCFILLVQY
ncbi:hypothetical protein [Staphylococcus saccharolyticus]|uniref:Uncharacterized protein n=1 Tax=Staphylococcus saccharolyticus TaxID=33028 RepID=A0A380H6J7_9STAP|nr:hypothetical protein [Staphylococcus saccharolyticus]SUM73407.1 Uncharacterised protein [Staphylococcus saccharolyticus]